ncbi:calcium-binding protein [Falsirhodobacter sp. alg1]|uniref:calcium-binding protein n=1 Tax=Falsirhodobacter sp. alg1 TaxID=1472418 RepID=UPI0007897D32|nr:calcium-binding protein [Falsirhodobacter sp. alg1]
MSGLIYQTTFTGGKGAILTGITDLDIRTSGGTSTLYATTRGGGGLTAMTLTGTGLQTKDYALHRFDAAAGATPSAEIVGNRIYISGLAGGAIESFALEGDGGIGGYTRIGTDFSAATGVTAMTSLTVGGTVFAYTAHKNSAAINIQTLSDSRLGTTVQRVTDFDAPATGASDIGGMTMARSGSTNFLITTSLAEDRVTAWAISSRGTLTEKGSVGGDEGLGLGDPSIVRATSIGGASYVLVGSTGSSSISVLSLSGGGALRATDHVIDGLETRFSALTAMTTVTVGGRVYVMAGGADDGVSLMTLLPDGTLLHLATIEDTTGRTLAGITALAATSSGSGLRIFAASGQENGIAELRYALPDGRTLTGNDRADTLTGGTGADLLYGGAGNDSLSGMAGNDILIDGAGSDVLRGGAGADVFIMSKDGERDVILDFDKASDRLDLSRWPMFRSALQLEIKTTTNGAILRFGDEELEIRTADGKPLTATQIRNLDLSDPMSHIPLQSTNGTSGRDLIQAGQANDYLRGYTGSDTLDGGLGADTLDGGNGDDWASYERAKTGVEVNLRNPQSNTGEAAGDVYISIENIRGTDYADRIQGNTGSNIILGGAGNDFLVGDDGDDTLMGEDGDDRLIGGAGADVLDGGDGRDVVDYRDSSSGLIIDMRTPSRNTGDAKGDLFISIEDIMASEERDVVFGNDIANQIYGQGGNDLLRGFGGDDTLDGGAGNDTLIGGAGADFLVGGDGKDMVNYVDSPIGLVIDLARPGTNTGIAAGDVYISIENVVGSKKGDMIFGNKEANMLNGGNGNDTLEGRQGNDTMLGGNGNDWFMGGSGADLMNGGKGRDTIDYSHSGSGMRIDMLNTATSSGLAKGDKLISVEDLIGSKFTDFILGTAGSNRIDGGTGNDTIEGRAGNDTLYGGIGKDWLKGQNGNDVLFGGLGNDTLSGGAGRDVLNGGLGSDTADYSDASHGLTADLQTSKKNTGFAAGDTYSSIENLTGSKFNDTLRGNQNANTIIGGTGNDKLFGADGADKLQGGAGNDTLTGGAGADRFIFNSGHDRITDFQDGIDTLYIARSVAGGRSLKAIINEAQVEDGHLVLSFGKKHSIIIDGLHDPVQLVDDMVFL